MYNNRELINNCHIVCLQNVDKFCQKGADRTMHLIKDENGNSISHAHDHGCDSHGHSHCGSCQSEQGCQNETVALLTYMLQHNEHHAAELEQMAENLKKLNMDAAAKTILEGVADFQKGNMRLGLALTLVKEQLKEEG